MTKESPFSATLSPRDLQLDMWGRRLFAPFGASAIEEAKRRRRLFLSLAAVAVVSLASVTVAASRTGVPKIENHLREDVFASVKNDVEELRVRVNGTHVVVSGDVASVAVRDRVMSRVRNRWGVRSVDVSDLRTNVVP